MHGCRNPIAWPVPSPRFGGELNEPRCEPAPVVSASVTVVACSCEHCQVCVALCCVLFCSVCLRPAAISVLWWVASKHAKQDIAHYICTTQRTMCLCCCTVVAILLYDMLQFDLRTYVRVSTLSLLRLGGALIPLEPESDANTSASVVVATCSVCTCSAFRCM